MQDIAQLTQKKYKPGDADMSIEALTPGEIDVLEQVREALGWPSIKSLAVKYYPAFPNRKHWLEALRRAKYWSRRVNIVYLLKTLASVQKEKLEAAFQGRGALNRLTHKCVNKKEGDTNRLVPPSRSPEFTNANGRSIPPLLRRVGAAAF